MDPSRAPMSRAPASRALVGLGLMLASTTAFAGMGACFRLAIHDTGCRCRWSPSRAAPSPC